MEQPSRAAQYVEMLSREGYGLPTATPRERFGHRARQVLIMRYLHDMTLEQVGQSMGLTRERVRQIEAKAIRMIRAKADLREKIRDTLKGLDER